MFPAQRGLYGHRSTMNQFAKPGYQFMNYDPFPFTNANLTDLSPGNNKSLLLQQYPSSDDLFDHELSNKEDSSINNMSIKKPLSKAERRAEHNAIERARRENLNTKFQSLAQVLPNLINYRRPSKSQIVEKALDWVKQSLSREERYRYQLLQLQRENKRLLAQLMSNQQQHQEHVPTLRHSMSTPTHSNSPGNVAHNIHADNTTSPVAANMNLNTTATVPMALNTSPIPNMYSTDFINTDGWSNNSHQFVNAIPQMSSYTSNDELAKHDFSSTRSDDEDNASSSNEDDIDYHSSPCNPSSIYIEHNSSSNHKQFEQQQQHMMAPELYSVGGFPASEAQFDPALMNNWNNSKYSSHTNIDPGNSSRPSALHMLS